MVTFANVLWGVVVPAQLVPEGSRADVFDQIYTVFLALGTIVGVVVIAYMLWKAWKYRAAADHGDDADRPELGELPSGGGGGRKLFLSFSLSAIVVVSLISWTYFTLLYVEDPSPPEVEGDEPMTIRVIGHQFYWEFVYPNGYSTNDELVVPEDRRVRIVVTASDVFHNFGIPELRAKTDAIPGQETETWFLADDTGTYQANCYELCGSGHSHMSATVQVVSQSEFETWYANTTNSSANASANETGTESIEATAGPNAAASTVGPSPASATAPTPKAADATRVAPTPRARTEVIA
jgi:cytochrome c oxidase subunit 2